MQNVKSRGLNAAVADGFLSQFILNEQVQLFLQALHTAFEEKRQALLLARKTQAMDLAKGKTFDFLPETAAIRTTDWKIDPLPKELLDRRVEITGPVDRKMIINGLNSGAKVFMADFEDSNAPTWQNVIDGHTNLYDAVRKNISYTHPETQKTYQLKEDTAILMVRPRGLHLQEKHFSINGATCSASIFDFAVFFYHNALQLIENGSAPYFYLPKLEHHLEARWWNELIVFAQNYLGIPQGTVKVTVLIETLPAGFQMDEILFELRHHIAGLNCGRWDYIFSYIKKLGANPNYLLPDRSEIGMADGFLAAYSRLLIATCHRRGALAMGGMAAQIPIKNNEEANAAAFEKVRLDKLREVNNGHDGTWVAHPALIPVAMAVFNEHMPTANQLDKKFETVLPSAVELLQPKSGAVTLAGVENNFAVAWQYLAAWLSGNGCVPINNLMEDAATAEIARVQLWQWLQHKVKLESGLVLDKILLLKIVEKIEIGLRLSRTSIEFEKQLYPKAKQLLLQMILSEELPEFLTTIAYEHL